MNWAFDLHTKRGARTERAENRRLAKMPNRAKVADGKTVFPLTCRFTVPIIFADNQYSLSVSKHVRCQRTLMEIFAPLRSCVFDCLTPQLVVVADLSSKPIIHGDRRSNRGSLCTIAGNAADS